MHYLKTKVTLTAAFLFLFGKSNAQWNNLIPEPMSIQKANGKIAISPNLKISYKGIGIEKEIIEAQWQKRYSLLFGAQKQQRQGKNILLELISPNTKSDIKADGYILSVTPDEIHIKAINNSGLYYGFQTLLQALPVSAGSNLQLECVTIQDAPKYGWRGLMLDVSRHFFSKEDVKKYIDQMSRYKFNVLHWHLTDDAGWRIEIKKYPNLTKVGAWNVKKTGYFGTFGPVTPDEKYDNGGFYSQEDIKEIVAYAQKRHVSILPEIDIPGHSMAAVASYPELSGTPEAKNYKVYSGELGFVSFTDSGIVANYDNTLSPIKKEVDVFVNDVVSELTQLFPFQYIHIGGDECPKTFWKKSPEILAYMKENAIESFEEMQNVFTRKVIKMVIAKGKTPIGWDEILEGKSVPEGAVVMSWRGEKGGIEASQKKLKVIMAPNAFAYLDYMNGDPALEPHNFASLPLKRSFQYNPAVEGLDTNYLLGGQANLWTEQVTNIRHAEYMTWPRALAIAEKLWSLAPANNWESFASKLPTQFELLDSDSVKYAKSIFDPYLKVSYAKDSSFQIELFNDYPNTKIYYSLDNSLPDYTYPQYTGTPVLLSKDVANVRAVVYKDGKQISRILSVPRAELSLRLGKSFFWLFKK